MSHWNSQGLHFQNISCFHYSWIGTHFGHFSFLSFQLMKTLFHKMVFFGIYLFIKSFKTSQLSKCNYLSIKGLLLSSNSLLLNSTRSLKFSKHKEQFIFKMLSFRLNTRPYNRLDKKVTDFKEPKNRPVVPHTTKCFHHQKGEDTDNNKSYKTYT